VFRRLLACMLATTSSISLFAVSLETGTPEFGTVDFAEDRIVLRRFPKNAAERDTYLYLLRQVQDTPDGPRPTKDEIKDTCRRRFRVTVDSFQYCWREMNKVTGAGWDLPGRRPR
jgi:hypothetical protein